MLTANSPPPNNFSSFLSKQFDSSTGRDLTTDLWKAPYKYDSDRASYEIRSSGPDIQMDSKDDLYLKRKNGKVVASQMGFKESELMDAIKTVEEERKKTIEALEKSQKMADEIIKNQDKEALKKLENALKDFE